MGVEEVVQVVVVVPAVAAVVRGGLSCLLGSGRATDRKKREEKNSSFKDTSTFFLAQKYLHVFFCALVNRLILTRYAEYAFILDFFLPTRQTCARQVEADMERY